MSRAPRVLAIHLVRSLYERGYGAGRNSCEVSFAEEINVPVGFEASQQQKEEEAIDDDQGEERDYNENYRLMSVVTHKGYHDSGHYISYRRRKRTRKHYNHHEPLESGEYISLEKVVNPKVSTENMKDIETETNGPENPSVGSEFDGIVTEVEAPDSRTKWWEISDDVVIGVNRTDVLSKRNGVYLLFYERARESIKKT